MKRYDKGATVTELWPQWKERTGMTRATLVKVVEGTYDTRVARALHVILNRPSPAFPPNSTTPSAERVHRLTPEILMAIRAAARTGMPWGQIAQEFRAHPSIVRLIINGTYQTRAMKKALMMEAEAGAGHCPSSTEPSASSVKSDTDTTAEILE
ncbi:hypothetical protein J2W23_003794 [Variovorax boronicumulans]|uniref:hypothetical protein n=1 Tax=Variovorax boronicumulans TaxID=436515 RepID=UPI00278692F3|nr:hypothetical protein [Variovorax boronicumulans]MDQ0015394.1 hypothetical protein [Variovorax boronicumulans]